VYRLHDKHEYTIFDGKREEKRPLWTLGVGGRIILQVGKWMYSVAILALSPEFDL
jgi:hypothetical protein